MWQSKNINMGVGVWSEVLHSQPATLGSLETGIMYIRDGISESQILSPVLVGF